MFSLCQFTDSNCWHVQRDGDWGIMNGRGCGRKRSWPDGAITALYDWRASGKCVKMINKGHYDKSVIWKSLVTLKWLTRLLSEVVTAARCQHWRFLVRACVTVSVCVCVTSSLSEEHKLTADWTIGCNMNQRHLRHLSTKLRLLVVQYQRTTKPAYEMWLTSQTRSCEIVTSGVM